MNEQKSFAGIPIISFLKYCMVTVTVHPRFSRTFLISKVPIKYNKVVSKP
jgi:hypothetical protein